MLLTMGISGFSQETTITIGTGTSTSYYAPFDNFYKNTWVQTIYPASQINNAGLITAISFNVSDVPSSAYTFSTLTIYMGTSADSVNTSTSSWLPMSDLTEVYSITNLPVPSSTGWWTFQLDNPFPYDGVDNLVIVCSKTMPEYSSSLKFYYTSVTNSCLYRQSDSDVSFASHPGSNTGTRSTYRPNLQLTMSASADFCRPVSHLTASNVTATDASFSWYSSIDATSYVLQYKTADGSWENDATSINVNDTAYDILGVLSPSTNYTARVAGICSSGDTSGWRSVSFTTACVALDQLPFQEDFDSYSTGENAYPICWAKINTYSSNRPYCNSSNHYDGVASLYFYCSSTTYNVAITPAFDESIAINGLQADFMYRANATSDRLIVGVMTDFTDINTFEPVDTIMPGSSPTTWRNVTVDFSNYQDNGHYIAFMNKNTTANGYAYIDNLTIDLIPTCVKPQNVVLSNITVEGCDVDWTPEGDESIWEVVAVEHNADVETGTPETAYSHPFTLQGLLDDTQYDVYVRANCGGGDYSAWTFRQVFTTNPLCTPARQLTVGQVTGTSALVSWQSAEFGATGYTVGYSEAGQENWNTETVTGTQYMLSGLDPDTEYDVYVLTNCDAGQTTPVTTSFTTHCLAGGDPFTEGTVSTYHIPVNNYYNYTYSQQIFLASELNGAATIDSIAFFYDYATSTIEKSNVTVYLGHTSQSTFSGTSNYISPTNFTQVYSGHMNCHQGWNTFVLSTPFQYNGMENLVLAVDDNSGDYDGSSYVFRAHDAGATRTVYYYSDSSNPDPANPTSGSPNMSTSTNRSDVKFFIPCDNTVTCIAPNVYVTGVTDNSVSIAWAPGNTESSWELEYSEDGNVWNSEGLVSTSPYTVDNLNPNTLYYIRLRSVCGGGETSGWSIVNQRTECAPMTTLPILENFDSYTGSTSTSVANSNLPYCWSHYNQGTNTSYTGYPIIYTSATLAASGSNAMRFYTTTGTTYADQIAILPAIDVDQNPISTLQLAFDARNNSTYTFTLVIGVMSDPTDATTFEPINTIVTTSNTYENYEIPLSAYTGTGAYIAMKAPQPSSSYNSGYVDNIRVELIPECPKPIGVASSNVTTNSVTLSWTETGDATSWEIIYGPTGFTPGSAIGTTETVYDNPYTVTGLSASTGYDFYIQSDCGGSYSSMSNVHHVTTLCDVISSLPFMENFDAHTGSTSTSVSVNNLPYCWSNLNTGTSSSYSGYPIIYTSATYAASGSNAVRFYTYTTSGTYSDQIAILPEIDVNTFPMNTLQLTFDARQNSTSYTFSLVVGVMTDPTNASTFTPVQTLSVTSTSYHTFEVPLTNYAGTGSYIAIKAPQPTSGYNYGYIDNIVLDLTPLCDKPTNVTASNITATTADINWMPGGNETEWEMVVVPSGMAIPTGTPESVASHPYTLTDLTDNTAYDVYVRADCGTGADFSSWSSACHFTTTPLCSAPTNVTVSQITGTSALLTWTPAVFGATGYTVAYTETGMDSWTTQTVTGDSYMLSGLTPETAYTLTISSECDEGSAPVVTKTFSTTCLYGGDLHIGDGTSTTSYLPEYSLYEYSYTQQIFLSSEMGGAGDISSIAFEATTVADPTRNIQIYLMHTSSASGSSWLDASSAQQVYSGNYTFAPGWNTFNFTTPFQYNGTDNLAVIVVDATGNWSSTNYFRNHTASQSLCRYTYQDDIPYSISSTPSDGTSTTTRNNVIFGTPCDNTVTCIAPNVYVSAVTENSIAFNWVPGNGESSWELETSTDGTTWNSEGTVTSAPYILSGLNPNTMYYIRMRSICGGGEFSSWVVVNQSTECGAITALPYMENFDSHAGATTASAAVNNLPNCWNYFNIGTNTSYSGYPIIYTSSTYAASGSNLMRFYTSSGTSYSDQVAILPEIDVTVNPINTLQLSFDARNNSSYTFTLEIGVMTDPTDMATFMPVGNVVTTSNTYTNYEIPLDAYTGTGAYIAIRAPQPTSSYNAGYVDNVVVELIPTCPKPTQVNMVNNTSTSIDLGWTENGTATSWLIEYGPVGFTHGNGTTVNASTNPYTVSGLNPSTTYDFYVQADCNGGDISNYSSVFSASTECEAISQLPYTENFDTYSTGENAYPLCWGKINTYSSPRPYVHSTHYEGVGSLYFYASSTTYNIAVVPQFDATIPVNTLQATFMYRANNSTDYTIVGVMTNANDATTFVPVDTIYPGSPVSTWIEQEVVFSNYTGNGQYIAFYNGNPTTTCYTYIDNLVIDLIPTCPKPHNLTINDATTSSIELGWTEVGSATSWEIAYGAPGFDPEDASEATYVTANTNPFTVQNLNNSTTYNFYVRALCSSSDISSWTSKLSASTTMLPIDLPYTADFTDAADAWVLNNGNCTNYWAKGTVNNEGALFVTDNGTTPNYTITSTSVVSAQKLFTVGTNDSITITFDVEVKGEGSFDYMKLFLAPASAQFPATTTVPTGTYGINSYSTDAYDFYSNGYGTQSSYHYIMNMATGTVHVVAKMPNPNATPTATSTALLVFAWKNDGSVGTQPPATITNLTVTADGSGPGPVITDPTVTTAAASNIEQTTATLNATITNPDNVTITAKGFEWKTTMGGTYTQIAGTGTGNNFTANLTGLTAGTSYTYKAFITFNGQTVYGTEQTFTTQNAGPAPCPTPTNVTTSNITHESITISWNADPNVSSWNIQYRPENGTLSSAASSTNSYTITGLIPQTTYEIQVQANCSDGGQSEWSALVSATTTVGINNYLENSVTLYPNPAKEYIDVRIDGDVNVTGMEVYDVYGKLINTVNVIDNMTRINVSALADGMYFVRVKTEQGMVTKRFVKK